MSDRKIDRARGLLVGLAVGDALGAPVEFDHPGNIAGRRDELFALPGGGGFGWAPGEFTDDTQMALVLARHLRNHEGSVDQDALAAEFADWARAAADVGIQTRSVLSAVAAGESWRAATARLRPDSAGNGSLMRVAPVALAAKSRDEAAELGRLQSEITHPNGSCLDACAVISATLWELVEGDLPPLEEIARLSTENSVRHAILRAIEPPHKMSGFVIDTLAGALWAVYGANRFDDAVWRAVSLGWDADTVGAVAGAMAGARWGFSEIPERLSSRLQSRHPTLRDRYPSALIELADNLLDLR